MQSSRWFRLTLALYPRELRERFGDEMELVFDELLADARRDGGVLGVLHVWRFAISELITVAVPSRLGPVAVPLLAFVVALVWFIGVIGLMPLARSH